MHFDGTAVLMKLDQISTTLVESVFKSQLDTFSLSGNNIAVVKNLAPLEYSLTGLDLSQNVIHSCSGLGDVPRLKELNLSGNLLENTIGVESLKDLRCLRLANNRIASVEALKPLQELPMLHTLTLDGNPVAKSNPSQLRSAVRQLLPQLLYLDEDLLPSPATAGNTLVTSDNNTELAEKHATDSVGSAEERHGVVLRSLASAPAVALAGLAAAAAVEETTSSAVSRGTKVGETDEAEIERSRAWKLAWHLEDATNKVEVLQEQLREEKDKTQGLVHMLEEERVALKEKREKDQSQRLYFTTGKYATNSDTTLLSASFANPHPDSPSRVRVRVRFANPHPDSPCLSLFASQDPTRCGVESQGRLGVLDGKGSFFRSRIAEAQGREGHRRGTRPCHAKSD